MPNQLPTSEGGLDLSAIGPADIPVDKESVRLAKVEESFLLDGRKREHERTQAVKDRVHKLIIAGITLSAVFLLFIIFVRVLHMILDKEHLWLTDSQVGLIDTTIKFVVSSTFGGLIFKRIEAALK